MTTRTVELVVLAAIAAGVSFTSPSLAEEPPPSEPAEEPPAPLTEDEATRTAREAFVAGAALVKKQQWAEALAAFERSHKLRPHAVTTFNIGYCERALGQYTRARSTFGQALRAHEASASAGGGELSERLVQEIEGYVGEIDHILVRARVTLAPDDVALSVDGRPLLVAPGEPVTLIAGTRPPGEGERPPAGRFTLVLNPGPHVFTLRRKGFANAVVQQSFTPGSAPDLDFVLDRLPATLEITASEPGAVVAIDGVDVGVAPLTVSRPLGAYRVLVQKPDFVAYETEVVLEPGETTRMRAPLSPEEPALYERWWFWTGAAAVIAGAVVVTYAATRPDPERPAVDGGGLGWAVEVP